MNRFHFSALLVIAATLTFFACQKDPAQDLQKVIPGTTVVADRAPNQRIYGVNVYDGTTPCEIYELDEGSGNVIANFTPWVADPNGSIILLENLKGICVAKWGQYFLTTGNPANPALPAGSQYHNALFKVNPLTGQCSYMSTSNIGSVSDLEYDPNSNYFYGLRMNTNAIIEISDPGSNYSVYNGWAVNGINAGYVLKGLSLVRDANGIYFIGCATTASPFDPAQLYTIDIATGNATWLTDLDPVNELAGGHCAIGFDIDINRLLVNRSDNTPAPIFGLNSLGWPTTPPTTNSGYWGAGEINFEDLTSWVY